MTELNLASSTEKKAISISGVPLLLLIVALLALSGYAVFSGAVDRDPTPIGTLAAPAFIGAVFLLMGCYSLQPNEAVAITLFGRYKGTNKTAGLHWLPFWYGRKKISLRVRNVISPTLKVNDKGGNPIEIAAVVVWRVVDSARALFDVESYETFVQIQVETALREIASHFAYDHAEDHEPTLRGDAEKVSALLRERLNAHVGVAGVVIDSATLSHLAYAPEIAGAMLKRQQAEAVLGARAKIVAGAVSMVESALEQLSSRNIVHLDDERRAAMVSNLLVVLCADREVSPVVNAGTLYTG